MSFFTCFKANDIGGRLGIELNEDFAYRIGYAYAQFLVARRMAIGGDIRLSFGDFSYCDRSITSWLLVAAVQVHSAKQNPKVGIVEGLSLKFNWWMYVTAQDKKPLLRWNIEAKVSQGEMKGHLGNLLELFPC
ncbi:hypothetical protein [Stutzerimonas stutzeri]|uniref:hypothetical protein n=1 Tax=Stutzerimonas stutzeri TaxID=316 RepID=UPI00177ABCEB|nr:hypothetical protein [Stutzerimonas stutzeri]